MFSVISMRGMLSAGAVLPYFAYFLVRWHEERRPVFTWISLGLMGTLTWNIYAGGLDFFYFVGLCLLFSAAFRYNSSGTDQAAFISFGGADGSVDRIGQQAMSVLSRLLPNSSVLFGIHDTGGCSTITETAKVRHWRSLWQQNYRLALNLVGQEEIFSLQNNRITIGAVVGILFLSLMLGMIWIRNRKILIN